MAEPPADYFFEIGFSEEELAAVDAERLYDPEVTLSDDEYKAALSFANTAIGLELANSGQFKPELRKDTGQLNWWLLGRGANRRTKVVLDRENVPWLREAAPAFFITEPFPGYEGRRDLRLGRLIPPFPSQTPVSYAERYARAEAHNQQSRAIVEAALRASRRFSYCRISWWPRRADL